MKSEEIYLDQLLGRMVLARNNRRVGRLEEFQAERRDNDFRVVGVAIGSAGLMERLNVGARALFGIRSGGRVARWDQIDVSDPEHPRLTCAIDELRPVNS